MAILVTGGMGFIGSYTCEALLAAGHDVISYDLQTEGNTLDAVLDPALRARLICEQGDVLDRERLLEVIRKHRVTRIVHLAAMLTTESQRDPLRATRVNCEGTAQVFEAAKAAQIERVVWASSISVWYGLAPVDPELVISNDDRHRPADLYGASKAFNETLARVYAERFGVRSIGLRFAHGTGAGRLRGGGAWAAELIDKPALGIPGVLELGDELENWLSVEDEASAVVAAITAPLKEAAGVYTVAGFDLKTRREAAAFVQRLLPEAQIEVRPGRLGRAVRYDLDPIAQAIGWRPRYDMETMLTRMINRVRKAHDLPPVG